MLDQWFFAHPRMVGESYGDHQRMAWRFAARLLLAGAACFVHGLVPTLFQTTGSRTVKTLHDEMVLKRRPESAQTVTQHGLMGDAI